jgi:hypothetical protein
MDSHHRAHKCYVAMMRFEQAAAGGSAVSHYAIIWFLDALMMWGIGVVSVVTVSLSLWMHVSPMIACASKLCSTRPSLMLCSSLLWVMHGAA